MRNNSSAQSALEYLLTYGWGFVVIAIVVGVLIFVTGGSIGGVTCQSRSQQMIVREWAVNVGNDAVGVVLQNATAGTITPIAATSSGDFQQESISLSGSVAQSQNILLQNLSGPQAGGNIRNGTINLAFRTSGGLDMNALIVCNGTVSGQATAVQGTGQQVLSEAVFVSAFGEANGTIARDGSGNNNNAALRQFACTTLDCSTDSGWVSNGKQATGIAFDGTLSYSSSDYLNISDSGASTLDTNRVTISVWVKPRSYYSAGYEGIIVSKDALWQVLIFQSNGTIQASFSPCWFERGRGSYRITAESWSHIAIVFDGSDQLHYVNGVLRESFSCSGTLATNDMDVRIGARGGDWTPYWFFRGIIDEVAVFNRALTQQEINAIYQLNA